MKFLELFKSDPPIVIRLQQRIVSDPSDNVAIASLETHPGFWALMNRLRVQKAILESRLYSKRAKDIREVDFLQSGISWLEYIENVCSRATNTEVEAVIEPAQYDVKAEFDKINSFIERVGSSQN